VNIAAVLSLAGIGFDRTRLKVVADPALLYNTHYIDIRGQGGKISIKLENVPAPENPKTAWLGLLQRARGLEGGPVADSLRYMKRQGKRAPSEDRGALPVSLHQCRSIEVA
jgi:hypothetical protein